jgi:TIGR00266 family protein
MKYEIKGGNFPVVICTCDAGEKLLCEAGAMSWMSANMKMSTNMTGGLGKAFGRMFSGESMFMNSYEAQGGEGMIAFASTMPGEIRAIKVELGKDVILQKRAFLAAESGVELSVFLQKRLGSGFFGGEGFIMEKVSGEGMVFAEIDGSAVEYTLEKGQSLVVDTGYVAIMDATCTMEVQTVPGVKNVLFGGEGLFNTVVKGPGRVIVQTMPMSKLAGAIGGAIVKK